MLKSIEMTGTTRDDAIKKALNVLGLDRDDVSVEVLDNGKRGFLGFGSTDAKVRITYEVPDEKPEVKVSEPEVIEQKIEINSKQGVKDETETKAEPVEEKKSNLPDLSQIAPDDPRRTTPHLVKAAPKNIEETKKSRKEHVEREPIVPYITPVAMADELVSEQAKQAVKFIDGLLEKLGIEGKATVLDISEPDHVRIDIAGKDMGQIIGRRGDTLDAIQYLTSLVLNQNSEEHLRLTVDTENYRAKRAESLERLARKMAVKVCKYHKAMTLEPMNPYERRIIHASLQNFRGVTTHSTGTEPGRRVVISPDGSARPSRRGFQPRKK